MRCQSYIFKLQLHDPSEINFIFLHIKKCDAGFFQDS